MKQTNILLESGTNELEIVEFRVDEIGTHGETIPCHYGVNVAKVREIIRLPEVSRVVNAKPGVEGMIKLRDKVIPIINLPQVLNKYTGDLKADRVVVLEFNNVTVGILVHSVSRIYRISWKNVEPPSQSVSSNQITGLVKMEDRIILLLDFEKIVSELCSANPLNLLEDTNLLEIERSIEKRILVADDSPFIRSTLCNSLRAAGYTVIEAEDGQKAWQIIKGMIDDATARNLPISDFMDMLITDVEMPQMDGLHLTTLVRKEPLLNALPVIIFSSLASEDNKRKWISIGANYILTKPDLPNLVRIADELTGQGPETR